MSFLQNVFTARSISLTCEQKCLACKACEKCELSEIRLAVFDEQSEQMATFDDTGFEAFAGLAGIVTQMR